MYKKVIPCLDIKGGRVVKGVHFKEIKDAADPVESAVLYEKEGADEITFLDISATTEKRKTLFSLVEKVANSITIPLIVGGGISEINDIEKLLECGASKISINTAAVKNPSLIKEAAEKFGREKVIVAIDAKRKSPVTSHQSPEWEVYVEGGMKPTGKEAIRWAKEVSDLGAGEILPTSIDRDGTKEGYDLELTRRVAEVTNLPVIASGGAGTLEHLYLALTEGKAAAILVASLFHFRTFTVKEVKDYLKKRGVEVREDGGK